MHRCEFAPALASGCVQCQRAERSLIAERESIACTDAQAADRCAEFDRVLLDGARFAMRLEPGQALPFTRHLSLQCEVLTALRVMVNEPHDTTEPASPGSDPGDPTGGPDAGAAIEPAVDNDVCAILDAGFDRYGLLEHFPITRLLRVMASVKPRRRRRP